MREYNFFNGKNTPIDELTEDDFKVAIHVAYSGGITNIAPLGYSGDTLVLSVNGNIEGTSRPSKVSFRNFNGSVEALITSKDGAFLYHGRYDYRLGLEFSASEYWKAFNNVKHLIDKTMGNSEKLEVDENARFSDGFTILEKAMKLQKSIEA